MGNVYATWLPGYMEIEHHLSITKTGLIITIPYVCSVVGSVFAGWSSDWLGRRGVPPLNAGRIPFVAGLLGMAVFTALTATTSGLVMATVWAELRDVLQPVVGVVLVDRGECGGAGECVGVVRGHPELLRVPGRRGGAGVDGVCGAGDGGRSRRRC